MLGWDIIGYCSGSKNVWKHCLYYKRTDIFVREYKSDLNTRARDLQAIYDYYELGVSIGAVQTLLTNYTTKLYISAYMYKSKLQHIIQLRTAA